MKVHHHQRRKVNYCVFGYFLLIFLGIGIWIFQSKIVDYLIDSIVFIGPSSIIYEDWKFYNVEMKIGLFNWTNPLETLANKTKPRFEEFLITYRMEEEKVGVVHHPNNTLSFDIQRYFFYDKALSDVTESDYITSINVVTLQCMKILRDYNIFMRKTAMIGVSMTNPTVFVTKNVSELLFGGYKDPLLDIANKVGIVKAEQAGWFNGKNGSAAIGKFNIGSGLGNTKVSYIYNYKYKDRVSYSDKCGELGSSMPDLLHQYQNSRFIRVFGVELERMVLYDYKETFIYEGIEVHKYISNSSHFDCGNVDRNNSCNSDLQCRKFGTIGHNTGEVDMYFSLPHFLHADPDYREKIEGMRPNETEHTSYYLIHARTGIPLKIDVGYQLNVLMEPEPSSSFMRDVPEIMMPVLWYKGTYHLPEKFKILLRIIIWLPLFFCVLSLFFVIFGSFMLIKIFYFGNVESYVGETISRSSHGELEPLKNIIREKTNSFIRKKKTGSVQ